MKVFSIFLSALLLSVIYVITSNSPAAQAEDENAVAEDADKVAAPSGSDRFVVWADNSKGNYEILFKRSTDNGATWKTTVNLSKNAGLSENPQMAVSGSNVYVVWSDKTPGNYDILFIRSTDNGATWKAVVSLSNGVLDSLNPQIAVSGANVYVVWQEATPVNSLIQSKRSTDNGATWKAVVNLGLLQHALSPQVGASGTNVYVVWHGDSTGDDDIFFRRSTDNGATWKAPVKLLPTLSPSFAPQMAVSGSNVYVVWQEGNPVNSDILFKRSTDNGATWKAAVNLSVNAGRSEIPQIAISGANVYVVWSDKAPGNHDVLFQRSTDNGATWKGVVNLNNNAGESVSAQVAVSGANVYVAWSDDTCPPIRCTVQDDILFIRSTDNGATWKAVVNLSNSAGDSLHPQIAIFGVNVYLVWDDDTPGKQDISFTRSTDNGATWKTTVNLSKNAGISEHPQVAVSVKAVQ